MTYVWDISGADNSPSSNFASLLFPYFPIQTQHSCDMFNSQPYLNPEFHWYDQLWIFRFSQSNPSSFGVTPYHSIHHQYFFKSFVCAIYFIQLKRQSFKRPRSIIEAKIPICSTPPKWGGPPLGGSTSCHRCWESGSADSHQTNKPRGGSGCKILTIDTPFMTMMHMPSRCFIVHNWFLFFQVQPWRWSPSWAARPGCPVLSPPQRYIVHNIIYLIYSLHNIIYLIFSFMMLNSSFQSGDRPKLVLWFREEDPAKPIYTVDLRGFILTPNIGSQLLEKVARS